MAKKHFTNESRDKQCIVSGCERGQRSQRYCGKHYQRFRTHGTTAPVAKPKAEWKTCSIEGCDALARTRGGSLCEAHYYRQRRTGTVHLRPRQTKRRSFHKWTLTQHGYVMRLDATHPAASKAGYVYQHRAVFYDTFGHLGHDCNWCGMPLRWGGVGPDKLVVDHLDSDKQNNAASNLAPSCHRCNAARGLFVSWVMDHKDDPFLASLFAEASL